MRELWGLNEPEYPMTTNPTEPMSARDLADKIISMANSYRYYDVGGLDTKEIAELIKQRDSQIRAKAIDECAKFVEDKYAIQMVEFVHPDEIRNLKTQGASDDA